jgi:AcrR family transcriptional regulator
MLVHMAVITGPGRSHFSDEELLNAAREVFHARGYHAAQMRDLAAVAGTTKPTLYARLGPKDEIFRRVVEREAQTFMAFLDDAYARAAERPVHEMVDTSTGAFFEYTKAHPAGADLLFRAEPATPGTDIAERAVEDIIERVTTLVGTAIQRAGGHPGPGAALLAAAAVGASRQACRYALDHDIDLGEARELAVAFNEAATRGIDAALVQSDG